MDTNQQGVAWVKDTERVITGDTSSDTHLRGSKARLISAIIHIVCGFVEFALGIAILLVPFTARFYPTKYVGWGIWNGAFACVTGVYGIYSRRNKCLITTYIVLAIIGAVFSCASLIWASLTATKIKIYASRRDYFEQYFMYITLCVAFGVQMVTSVIGVGFSCFDVCSANLNGSQNQEKIKINPDATSSKLPGASVRLICGIFQILFGVVQVALGITLLFLPLYYFDRADSKGWGIWNGVVAFATGLMGISSGRGKCRIKIYLVSAFVATLLSATCFISHWVILSFLTRPDESRHGHVYVRHVVIYLILCVSFGLQMLVSMIGFGHSYGAACSKDDGFDIKNAVYRYDRQDKSSQQLE